MVIVEGKEINVVLNMRPHHARMPEYQDILRRKRTPAIHAKARSKLMSNMLEEMHVGYRFDVLKSLEECDVRAYEDEIEKGDIRLQLLTDDSFIQLDLREDLICFAACRRRHCSGTRYLTTRPAVDIKAAEEVNVRAIKKDLIEAGYKSGEDYFDIQTTHTLYDFEGKDLNHGEAIPKIVKFNGLIVRTGALRDPRIKPAIRSNKNKDL
ncbi:MAG TPA: hypothetical protein VF189_06815 [Patescibacteria group bacterium]